jgi:hypothetical protein
MKTISEFKQSLIIFCLFCFIITIDTKATEAVEGEYIIKYKNCYKSNIDAAEKPRFPSMNASLLKINSKSKDSESELASLQNDPCIEYVEPNYIFKIETTSVTRKKPNDPEFNQLWGLEKIQAEKAWDIHTGNSDVIIAVIDTGVDYNHPDLKYNMWKNPGEIAANGIDDDNNGYIDDIYGYDFANDKSEPMDDNSHGSHVAGIIAASGDNTKGITGVNWSAKIMALKVTQYGSINTDDAISAIEYAKLMGAKIINASWHIDADDHPKALYDAIQVAKDAGILFVTAAGNKSRNIDSDNPFACLQCPASYDLDNIISVAATDENDGLSPRSNFGSISVDIAAPGTNIYSTILQEEYAEKSGTSMAAPYVTGVASLLWSINPNFTYREVKDIILSNIDPIDALKDKTVSGGRLNAYKALQNTGSTVSTRKGPVAICKTSVNNFNVTFDASNSFGNIKSYKWIIYRKSNLDSNEEKTKAKIKVKFGKPDNYTAKLIITDDMGLTDEKICSVKVPSNVPPPSSCITLGSNELNSLESQTAIQTSAPFTLNLDGPKYVNECIQEPKTNSSEKIIKYIWLICQKNTNGNCDYLPDAGHHKKFTINLVDYGSYIVQLTAKSEKGKNIQKEIKINILPELGQGFGFDNELSKVIPTSASFAGGISVGDQIYQANMKKNISELTDMSEINIDVTGEINVDLRHIGMQADLLVVILDSETSKFFMLDSQGNFQDWDPVILSHIVPFEIDIRLKNRLLIPIYKHNSLISGKFNVFLGYRLFNGKVFGGGPIQIIVE